MSLLQKLFRRRKKISDERMAELSKAYWEWLELNPDAYEEGALDKYITMDKLKMYDESFKAFVREWSFLVDERLDKEISVCHKES